MSTDTGDGAPRETFGGWLRKQEENGAVVREGKETVDGSLPRYVTVIGERTTVDLPRLADDTPLTEEMIRHLNQSLWLDETR